MKAGVFSNNKQSLFATFELTNYYSFNEIFDFDYYAVSTTEMLLKRIAKYKVAFVDLDLCSENHAKYKSLILSLGEKKLTTDLILIADMQDFCAVKEQISTKNFSSYSILQKPFYMHDLYKILATYHILK